MTLKSRLAGLEQRAKLTHSQEVEVCRLWPGEDLQEKYGPARPGVLRIVERIVPPKVWPGDETGGNRP
jgi:hypothetical protein